MTKAKPEDEIKALEDIKKTTKRFSLPDYIKPCVSLMLDDNFEKGGDFSRDRAGYIIATELRRVGKSPEISEKILNQWDRNNIPPLGISKIRSKVKSAYSKDYSFGCNNEPVILEYCKKINKDFCQYYKQISFGRRIGNDRDFIRYGWPNILSGAERDVYYIALPELEKRRGIQAGDKIFASHREISKICGVALGGIGRSLERLQKRGLITYKKGEPYRWRNTASEIKRIIPIPKPAQERIKDEFSN